MKSQNKSAVRSREWIAKALLELMDEKPYEDITVSDIALQANVVRKTFYRNYKDKEEVITDYLKAIEEEFIVRLQSSVIESFYDFGMAVFEFWKEYVPVLRFFHEKGIFYIFRKEFEKMIPKVGIYFPCEDTGDESYDLYCIMYVTGGFWQILCQWILHGAKESPEKMAGFFERFRSGWQPI